MNSKITQLFITILTVVIGKVNSYCDVTTTTAVREGNLGQTNTFSWLGILRVILYDRDPRHPDIAVTGVVLIKREYALINAHDVSRVPISRLRENGRVMFLGDTDVPWYCKPKAYTAHPEYGPITHNTIAILELNLSNITDYPLTPICWSSQPLNTSTFLYAAGFTDENKLLEKVFYKIQYTDKKSCSEFYDRAKLGDKTQVPVYYICGHASSSKTQCVWDNGMVLISNASEIFTLIGFGIRGPGCAAPARFINLQAYYDWMEEVTSIKDEYDDYRRDGGFEEVPLHNLFEMKLTLRDDGAGGDGGVKKSGDMKHIPYPADVQSPRYFNIDESDDDAISIFPFNNTYESYDNACNIWRTLMYREYFELKAEGRTGSAVFKVSLYDMLVSRCSCIKITMDTESHSSAILSIKEEMDLTEGEALTSSEEMFENLMKVHPIQELYTNAPVKSDTWEPGPNLRPAFIKEYYKAQKIENYHLYIRFGIKDKAIMKIEMYGEPYEPGLTTTTTEKVKTLRLKVKEERIELRKQKLIKRPSQGQKMYEDRLPKTQLIKSGSVKEFPGARSKSLLTKARYKGRVNAKATKTTTSPDHLRFLNPIFTGLLPVKPNRGSSNFTRHASRPVSPTIDVPPSTFYSKPAIQVTRRPGHKYDKVHLHTQTFHLSTPYPTALVESVSGAARSPRGSVVLVTLVKVLCFDILTLLINF